MHRHVRLAVVDDPPFSIRSNNSHLRGNDIWDGYVIHIIKAVAQQLNWTYELHQNNENAYDKHSANGTWQGVAGDVVNGKADIAVAILTINEERRKKFLFSFPVWIDRFAIVVSEKANHSILQEASSWFAQAKPTASATAMAVFALALACALALLVAEFFVGFNDKRSAADDSESDNVRREEYSAVQHTAADPLRTAAVQHAASSRRHNKAAVMSGATRAAKVFILTAEMLVRLLTLRDTPWEPASRSGRIMMSIWAAFCGIFTAVYAAQVYSAITVVKPWRPPFRDFSTMRQAGYQLMAHKLSAHALMLEHFPLETDEERAILHDNLRPARRALWPVTREDTMKLFNSGAKVAILTSEWQARLFQDNHCDVRAIPFSYHNRSGHRVNGFQTEFCAFLVRQGDEQLVHEMNMVIRQLWATGLIDGLRQQLDKWNQNVLGLHTCKKSSLFATQVLKNEKALTLSSYSTMFWLLLQGFSIALLVLIVEAGIVVGIKWSRRRGRKSESVSNVKV